MEIAKSMRMLCISKQITISKHTVYLKFNAQWHLAETNVAVKVNIEKVRSHSGDIPLWNEIFSYLGSNSLTSASSLPQVSVHCTFLLSVWPGISLPFSLNNWRSSSITFWTGAGSLLEGFFKLLLRETFTTLPLSSSTSMEWSSRFSKARDPGKRSWFWAGPTLRCDGESSPAEARPKQTKEAQPRESPFLAAEASWRSGSGSWSTNWYWFHGETLMGLSSSFFWPKNRRVRPLLYPDAEEEKNPPPSTANNISSSHLHTQHNLIS